MNSLNVLVHQTMFFAIPLLIVAIGGMFSERSGVVNIALEGIMTMGAFAGVLFIHVYQLNATNPMNPQLLLLCALLISTVTGVIVALPHAIASIHLKANQTISGTAINMFAPAFAIYIARVLFTVQQIPFSNQFRIPEVPGLNKIPIIGPMFFANTYITTALGILILIVAYLVLYKTKFGLRLRACGEHPQAADSVGINVYGMRYAGVLISGALAGLGGLVFIIPISTNFNATVSGYGFLALAVLIFGQWQPGKVLGAAFFFGLMKAIAAAYSGISFLKNLPIPSYFYKMIPYIVTLVVLAFTSKKSKSPQALGIPYDKGKR